MPIIGWIRDLFGIQKDMYETKKTRLEIEKIEEEKREKLITPATLEDVKNYDPKFAALAAVIEPGHTHGGIEASPLTPPPASHHLLWLCLALIAFVLLATILLVTYIFSW